MDIRRIAVLIALIGPLGVAQAQDEKAPRGHAANAMRIFVDGAEFEKAILNEYPDAGAEKLRAVFLESAALGEEPPSGQVALILDAMDSILEEREAGVDPYPDYSKMRPECRDAYGKKVDWHKSHSGKVPYAFGKIVAYDLDEDTKTGRWTGSIDLCTWIGKVNYYFEIELVENGDNSMSLTTPPFPGTLDPPPGSDMSQYIDQWSFKLHAKKGAVEYKAIWKDNSLLAQTDPFYKNLEQRCFDTFYKQRPTGDMNHDLSDQIGYCMGRCDAKVLNTGD